MKYQIVRARISRGSTLLESLLALLFFLMILQVSLEFFGTARAAFFKLEDGLSARESAEAGLERIRVDVLHAGWGLSGPIALGLTSGIEETADGMTLISLEASALLTADAAPGAASVAVTDDAEFGAGRKIVISDRTGGEALTVASVTGGALGLDRPIQRAYAAGDSVVFLLRRVAYSFDAAKGTVRRKINSSSAQPLVEGVASFSLSPEAAGGLVQGSLSIVEKPGRTYGFKVLPRNLALARME
jgi:Tfp pilus assembly protein PilW